MNGAKKFDDPVLALKSISELKKRSSDITLDDGIKVTVRTLGAKEETDTFIDCMQLWGQAFLYKHKIETLCRSISHIDGVDLEAVGIDIKRDIIGTWSQEVVDEVYTEYARLFGEIDAFLNMLHATAQSNIIAAEKANETNSDEGTEDADTGE